MAISSPLTGGCQCKRLRYAVNAAPLALYVCHCTECQRQSTSAFGLSMPVPRAALTLTAGTPRQWDRLAGNGRIIAAFFCGDCGTRIFHNPSRNPAITIVKPGTLDDTSWLQPIGHIWARSAQRWTRPTTGELVYESQPEDFTPLYEAWQATEAHRIFTRIIPN